MRRGGDEKIFFRGARCQQCLLTAAVGLVGVTLRRIPLTDRPNVPRRYSDERTSECSIIYQVYLHIIYT